MNASAEKILTEQQAQGFSINAFASNPRLQVVTLHADMIAEFIKQVSSYGLQAIEYKPFLRFKVADILNQLSNNQLGEFLLSTIKNRDTGAFLLQYESSQEQLADANFNVILSTAISHLIGVPNFDSMYGKYYARFSVKNIDNSDSYLRQPHRRMELHNDGTYVSERTDWVIMQKMAEKNMEGGDSLILHVDDWQQLEQFYHHPLAKEDIQWTSPASKNINYKTHHPVFFEDDEQGRPKMLFIDQFCEPLNMRQGKYLHDIGESLEAEENTFNVRVPTGSLLVVNNHCWLHGRDKFVAHPGLHRELLRQRGAFYENAKSK